MKQNGRPKTMSGVDGVSPESHWAVRPRTSPQVLPWHDCVFSVGPVFVSHEKRNFHYVFRTHLKSDSDFQTKRNRPKERKPPPGAMAPKQSKLPAPMPVGLQRKREADRPPDEPDDWEEDPASGGPRKTNKNRLVPAGTAPTKPLVHPPDRGLSVMTLSSNRVFAHTS